jgi:hypothetical protein
LLRWLFENGKDARLAGVEHIVDDLGRAYENVPTVREMFSTYAATILGDLALLSEGHRQINAYNLWVGRVEQLGDDEVEKRREEEHGPKFKLYELANVSQDPSEYGNLAQLCDPTDGKFYTIQSIKDA